MSRGNVPEPRKDRYHSASLNWRPGKRVLSTLRRTR